MNQQQKQDYKGNTDTEAQFLRQFMKKKQKEQEVLSCLEQTKLRKSANQINHLANVAECWQDGLLHEESVICFFYFISTTHSLLHSQQNTKSPVLLQTLEVNEVCPFFRFRDLTESVPLFNLSDCKWKQSN